MSGDGEPTGSEEPTRQQPPAEEAEQSKHPGTLIFVIVVVAIAAVIALVLALDLWNSDGDENLVSVETTEASSNASVPNTTVPATVAPTSSAAVTSAPSTSAQPPTSTASVPSSNAPASTAPPGVDDLDLAVWPLPDSDVRYSDPVEAARGFAVDYVGFVDPIVGDFAPGDLRSGEVAVRRTDPGPVTTVLVRQLGADDTWWVIGSATDNIVVEQPEALATVASPLVVSGQARAFEGTVDVQLRADGIDDPLIEGFVTGSGGQDLGPFEGTFEFDDTDASAGALMLFTLSAEDGTVSEASVMRVFFAAA